MLPLRLEVEVSAGHERRSKRTSSWHGITSQPRQSGSSMRGTTACLSLSVSRVEVEPAALRLRASPQVSCSRLLRQPGGFEGSFMSEYRTSCARSTWRRCAGGNSTLPHSLSVLAADLEPVALGDAGGLGGVLTDARLKPSNLPGVQLVVGVGPIVDLGGLGAEDREHRPEGAGVGGRRLERLKFLDFDHQVVARLAKEIGHLVGLILRDDGTDIGGLFLEVLSPCAMVPADRISRRDVLGLGQRFRARLRPDLGHGFCTPATASRDRQAGPETQDDEYGTSHATTVTRRRLG